MTAKTMHQAEADLRTTLTDLTERYEAIAAKAATDVAKGRARQISQAARDIRTVLTTGQLPGYLRTEENAS